MESPLPSWNEGPVKSAIVDFVARVTQTGGKDFVPAAARVATFDNDGTLWSEQPLQVQVLFLADRVKQLAQANPAMRQQQPFKAFLEHDLRTLHELGMQGVQELFAATHSGMTVEEFEEIVRNWFAISRHPRFARRYTEVAFQPMLELLDYLRQNQFRTFIVSGGGVDFMRVVSEQTYGIAREQVVGSSGKLQYEFQDGCGVLMKLAQTNSFDDREAKAQNIGLHIGRRPLLAFGNSDGDLAMLRYARTGPGARLALLLHHDDEAREAQYDRGFRLSPLREGLERAQEYGITLVSMKRDWNTVFPSRRRELA